MNTPAPTPIDWHPADIQAALRKRGWTLRRLSIANGYSPSSFTNCMRARYPFVQEVIAKVIGVKPWEIWPSRYDAQHRPIYLRRPARARARKNPRPESTGRVHEHNINAPNTGKSV